MPSHERPQGEPNKDKPESFISVARFEREQLALSAYIKTHDLIFATDCELSVYRFQVKNVSHVAVIGEEPEEGLRRQLEALLAAGSPAALPPDIARVLFERRAQAKRLGPWVEGHYRPGRPM